ncbi:DUF6115 domain-containing protein [Sulfurospirillum barnesii]|uniref:Periplasmic protein n=1 Tax=Sulfurospirillum barnesii (strain ATCC 700032 / DSM 10660 / SES-3) TaxID=760154 RepID=I3XU77_SULBS|nr:hypothetical protein [Sulfurospirillum barnesii]AFL67501.1 hypothetical protein Sulba_0174 [Sulfurospirillum barnesii SES-3]
MSIELLGLVGLAALVIIVFLMVYIRDVEVNKKLLVYEKSIEELNYQNHVLNKALNELRSIEKEPTLDPKEIEKKIMFTLKEEIHKNVLPVIGALKEIENIIQDFKDEQSTRIDRIESRTKEMSFVSSSPSSSNEKLIIAHYARGKSEAEIAKDLRIGIGEVDLVLKLANLK